MAHMHGAGRVGRDIFDIDDAALAQCGSTIVRPAFGNQGKLCAPSIIGQAQIDKTRPCDINGRHILYRAQFCSQRLGQRARVHARRLRQHHGGIGRQIAMAGIARRLDRQIAAVHTRLQHALFF